MIGKAGAGTAWAAALAALFIAAGCGGKETAVTPGEDVETMADRAYFEGDNEAAIEQYQSALQSGASTTRLHNNLGNALFREQRYNAAEQSYLRALDLDPEYLFALNNLTIARYMAGETEEAMGLVLEAQKTFPNVSFLRTTEGFFRYSRGDRKGALTAFREAVRINPDSPAALNNLGVLAMEDPSFGEDPLPYFLRAIEKDPQNHLFHDSLGWYYFSRGMFAEATIEIGKAFLYDPRNLEVRTHYATVLEWIGKDREALEQWEKILELSQDRETRREALEHVWEIRGRGADATEEGAG